MKVNLLYCTDIWKTHFLKGYETERLQVLPMEEKHIGLITSSLIIPGTLSFVKGLKNISETDNWFRDVFGKRDYMFFQIKSASVPAKPVGFLMLNRLSGSEMELGGVIGKRSENKGYASEVLRGLISFIRRNKITFSRLYAEIHKENTAVEKVLLKFDFKRYVEKDKEASIIYMLWVGQPENCPDC